MRLTPALPSGPVDAEATWANQEQRLLEEAWEVLLQLAAARTYGFFDQWLYVYGIWPVKMKKTPKSMNTFSPSSVSLTKWIQADGDDIEPYVGPSVGFLFFVDIKSSQARLVDDRTCSGHILWCQGLARFATSVSRFITASSFARRHHFETHNVFVCKKRPSITPTHRQLHRSSDGCSMF